jgi:hypothetical protein
VVSSVGMQNRCRPLYSAQSSVNRSTVVLSPTFTCMNVTSRRQGHVASRDFQDCAPDILFIYHFFTGC